MVPIQPRPSPIKKGAFRTFLRSILSVSFLIQLLVIVFIGLTAQWIITNTITNMQANNMTAGFGFLLQRAGVSIPNSLIPYSEDSNYLTALAAGFVNTIVMAVLCIIASSLLGLLIGIGRLSNNWLVSKICLFYIETFRNIPPLLVIFFWYFAIIQALLPSVRDSIALPFNVFINQRGIFLPQPIFGQSGWLIMLSFAVAVIISLLLCISLRHWSKKRFEQSGKAQILWPFYILVIIATFLLLMPILQFSGFNIPQAGRFNISGGTSITPEFTALFLALSIYTSALIAEIVRSGLQGVDYGYKEAGASLGLKPRLITRLIVLPLALRIIIPPLSSQYMSLMKNTSLATAIGYTEIMRIGNTIYNQTGQPIQVTVIWIIVYLSLSLLISLMMNWFNYKTSLKGR
ncbi:amino acid ABC transporter permease [Bartonella sp. HY761]|uniref:amino acid ABC transporter permease n=1 Tax=Bartonella sp. HY761 TaxID=2979330 RepID=UPI0022061A89|nr:ABC transporter permease subunit [Bartonella sp. HY761]UXN07484.1 ABC transporter permease subunit [Bartonella sp. HY761]